MPSFQQRCFERALPLTLAALAACSAERPAQLPESPAAEIPIRRVVLYQNGVGYFEREGTIDGNVLVLRTRPSQINDLLKSLTVVDLAGGRAVSVSLPLEKSGDRVLAELPDQVRNANGLLDVLRVFRGARVEVEGRFGSVAGRVVGVENLTQGQPGPWRGSRDRNDGDEVQPDWRLTLRTDAGSLRMLPVLDIREVSLQDRALAIGLDDSLDVSLKEGEWKPIHLAVHLSGKAEHRLRASYIVEMPRWKPAYRLVLGDAAGGRPGALLQGWAVVDNVSGESWTDVRLSLVAGTPMSFLYDLHTSQFIQRVDLTPRVASQAPAPPTEEAGTEAVAPAAASPAEGYAMEEADGPRDDAAQKSSAGEGASQARKKKPQALRGLAPPMPAPASPLASAVPEKDLDELLERQAGERATTQKLGALFRYDLPDLVSVPDRSSTLVALVNERVNAQEVVYFRPQYDGGPLPTHPYRAVKLTNNTRFTLEQGPVTLYAQGTFVGEGFWERIDPGATHFVTFALDDQVSLSSDTSTAEEATRLLRIIDGEIVSEMLEIARTTYQLKNLHETPVTTYLRTLKQADWQLRNPPPGVVDTPTALLVPVTVGPRASAKVPLEWAHRVERHLSIDTESSTVVLQAYISGERVPPQIAAQLRQVLDVKRQLGDIEREAARLRKQHEQLSADEARVRSNIDTLRKTKGNDALVRDLSQKLAALEADLGKLSGKLVQLSEEQAGLTQRLKVLISGISLTSTSP